MNNSTNTTTPEKGNWAEQCTKLKAKFSILTDADLKFETGKKEEMLAKVATKISKTKEELTAIIAKL